MSWKYQADLEKTRYYTKKCSVLICSDDWELYNRLVKVVETVLNDDDGDSE